MNKKEIMCNTYNEINQAIWTYKCARNENLGLRDASVEKKLDAAMAAMREQLNKILKA